MRAMRWWVVAFLAGVILLASAGAFLWTLKRQAPVAAADIPAPRERCPDADQPMPTVQVPEETTPVILWGAGKVRLFLDGQPRSSPPEAPLRFAPGEHVLRVEAPGSSMSLTFVLVPFEPVLFHAEETPGAGLTLAALGPHAPTFNVPLDFTRTSATDETLLTDAGSALRRDDWKSAAAKLRAVSWKSRSQDAFLRLAAGVHAATGQGALAEAALGKVKGNDLPTVLEAWRTLSAKEKARAETPGLEKWNLLTQKFSTLLERFALEAPGPVQLATSRMSELSAGFVEATRSKDTLSQEETVQAAELALEQFVRALRRSRPEDCDFQSRISASL